MSLGSLIFLFFTRPACYFRVFTHISMLSSRVDVFKRTSVTTDGRPEGKERQLLEKQMGARRRPTNRMRIIRTGTDFVLLTARVYAGPVSKELRVKDGYFYADRATFGSFIGRKIKALKQQKW